MEHYIVDPLWSITCGCLSGITSTAFVLPLLPRKASMKTWSTACPCQQCSFPQGSSSFPLTKKITAKFFPDHLVAKKQQCWRSLQCLFNWTLKDSSSCNVPASSNNPITQTHVQWKAAAGVPMLYLPVQDHRKSYFLHFFSQRIHKLLRMVTLTTVVAKTSKRYLWICATWITVSFMAVWTDGLSTQTKLKRCKTLPKSEMNTVRSKPPWL